MSTPRNNRITRWLLPLCLCAATLVGAQASAASLATWNEQELAPYLASQLTEHPRFKGETVVFVALKDGAPAPVSNALVLALRDSLVDSLIELPGITIGWQPGHATAARDAQTINCQRDDTHYYIGLEATQLVDGQHRITLRVLDAEDRSWVAGTGKAWQGRLTRAQAKAFEQAMTDEYFRGSREVPFTAGQADMLAARLAHDLTCELMRQVAGEYVIAAEQGVTEATTTPMAGALELVRNNLSGNPALQITADAAAANARLEGKAHAISGDLHQYWVTLTPTGNAAALPAVSASAYLRLPNTRRPIVASSSTSTPTPMPIPVSTRPASQIPARYGSSGLIAPLSILEPRRQRSCFRYGSSRRKQPLVTADHSVARGECFLLQTRTVGDASVFLLNFQVIHGLVSVSGPRCGSSSPWISARAGQTLQFPAANDSRPSASAWQGRPGIESFYALAVSDRNAARELAALISQLPSRCTLSATRGLTGPALQAWLGELRNITERWPYALDWQAVRIEHVD